MNPLLDPLDETTQHVARSYLDEIRNAGRDHAVHALRPAHRRGQLLQQQCPGTLRIADRLGRDVRYDRELRRTDGDVQIGRHTSELQSRENLVWRPLLEKKK